MTWSDLSIRWADTTENVRQRWELLTDRDLRVIAGKRERLVGVLQQRYGQSRTAIEREVREFSRNYL